MLTVFHGKESQNSKSESEEQNEQRELQRHVYFSDDNRSRGARRLSIFMDTYRPELHGFDTSKLGYYIPDWETLVHVPDPVTRREEERQDDEEEFRKLLHAMQEGAHWIIIEQEKFQKMPKQYITYSKRAHLFGAGCGLLSIMLSRRWPRSYILYVPLSIASVVGAFYDYFYSKRPISQYMVEKDKVQLMRFPMVKFPRHTMVLRKIPPSKIIYIRNFVIAAISVCTMCYALITPSPPCICKWKVLELLREQELAKVRKEYSPENIS